MKIGILTLPLHTNYGGILQAYALQTVLERMGHEVVVFDTPNKATYPPLWILPLCLGKRILLKCMGRGIRVFQEWHSNKVRSIVAREIQQFVDNKIHRKVITKFSSLDANDYDAIVVGSDQVWRMIYFVYFWRMQPMENAFLDFAKEWNIKRISYAASFGTENWEYTEDQTKLCKEALQKFDAVSVREENGVKLCKQYFDAEALHVLDPTMLLASDDYIKLFKEKQTPKSGGTLLNYVLDETDEINQLIQNVASEKNMKPFAVNNPFEEDESKPLNQRIKQSVEIWLRGFYDADYVITDSFHACVFSIIFKKQFVVVGNESRGMARFESLLKMFGIEDRMIDASALVLPQNPINYDNVYAKLDKKRKESLDFLKRALA